MIHADDFLNLCVKYQINSFTGTPCSYLDSFLNRIIEHKDIHFYPSTNEGDAVAFASGVWLAGRRSVVLFQNSGLGNAVNPITSLSQISKIPFLGIVSLRGEPGGAVDEPQHKLMGEITTRLLELMKIPWSYFPQNKLDLKPTLLKAIKVMDSQRIPYFLVVKKDTIEKYVLKHKPHHNHQIKFAPIKNCLQFHKMILTRTAALELINSQLPEKMGVIVTTGKAGRELCETGDSPKNFYMVGSMGCALSIGQGVATVTQKPICIIDGDGALLMRLSSMATSGILQQVPILHILLDNHAHDSTGGQASGSDKICFSRIAQGCGYKHIAMVDSKGFLQKELEIFITSPKLTFIHTKISIGCHKTLGRPKIHPSDVAKRFQQHIFKN